MTFDQALEELRAMRDDRKRTGDIKAATVVQAAIERLQRFKNKCLQDQLNTVHSIHAQTLGATAEDEHHG